MDKLTPWLFGFNNYYTLCASQTYSLVAYQFLEERVIFLQAARLLLIQESGDIHGKEAGLCRHIDKAVWDQATAK